MNTYRFWPVLLGLALSLNGTFARADDERSSYVFASYGESDSEFSVTSNDTIQGDDKSYEIGFGYAFSKHLAVEGSYQNFGDPDGFAGCPPEVLCIAIVPFSREPVEIDGWAVALRGSVPFTDSLSGFARLGLLAWDASAQTPVLNDSGTDLLYGVGFAADYNESFGLQLAYERVELDIDTVKLGARFRF